MIQLDLSTFKPNTLLSKWWKALAGIFGSVQEAHNALEDSLREETAARISDKKELTDAISTESTARVRADDSLAKDISDEAKTRKNADDSLSARLDTSVSELESKLNTRASQLDARLDAEVSVRDTGDRSLAAKVAEETRKRQDADQALSEETDEKIRSSETELVNKIDAEANLREAGDNKLYAVADRLGKLAHAHKNYALIEGISAEDVARWEKSAGVKLENTERMDYFDEMCRDLSDKLRAVYAAMGVVVYDGGIDGQISDEAGIDGGEFGEEETLAVDFGGFEDNIFAGASAGAVLDGGTY